MSVLGKVGKFAAGAAALAAGGPGLIKAGYDVITSRNKFRKNRSYIEDAYQSAKLQQGVHESDVRHGEAESLNARGLLTPGAVPASSMIANAMRPGAPVASRTLGQRQQADTSRELGYERTDLENANKRALDENKASYVTDLIGKGTSAVKNAISIAGATNAASIANPEMQTSAALSPSQQVDQIAQQPLPSVQYAAPKIAGAMGIDNPANWWGGIHPLDPLGAPGSAWNTKRTISGAPGTPNSEFHL